MAGSTSVKLACEDGMNATQSSKPSGRRFGSVQQLLCRALAFLEYCVLYGAASVLGPSSIVRYLRNPNPRITVRVLRSFGASIGSQTTIKGSVIVDNVERDANSTGDFSHLKIGNNCYIGESVFFDLANEVIIQNNAVIAGGVSFVTHAECRRSSYLSSKFPRKCAPIFVDSGAWVGFRATILPGVRVGSNSVIGAHSLLLRDSEPQCVFVGSPARKLKQIE